MGSTMLFKFSDDRIKDLDEMIPRRGKTHGEVINNALVLLNTLSNLEADGFRRLFVRDDSGEEIELKFSTDVSAKIKSEKNKKNFEGELTS